jgi:alkyl hydroperoxide reductase subunit F
MLDASIAQAVRSHFDKLVAPIELVAHLDASEAAGEIRALLTDLSALSSKISTRIDEGAADVRSPSFTVGKLGEAPRITFAGVPMGHEFTSLILALLQASGYAPKLDEATVAAIRALSGTYVFETYISLSCQNCPDVVQALNAMSTINPSIRHTMIDGSLFQREVDERKIMAVPSVLLNGEPFGQGRMSIEEILAKVDTGAEARAALKLADKAPYDVLIVGGGPSGAAAAIYAARKGIRTAIVTERFGGQLLDTVGIENFVSVEYTEGPKLVMQLNEQVKAYGIEVITTQRASELVPAAAAGGLHEVKLASGASLKGRTVILSTGARWREMGIPGEATYRTKGVTFCPHCDGPLFKGKRVAVIGGGNSGIEAAIDLAGLVAQVTVLEFDTKLRADAVLQRKLATLPNVRVMVNAQTTEVVGDGTKVNGLVYRDRTSGEVQRIDLEGIFVQIGLLPNTDWLRGAVTLSPRGEIEVDARGQSSAPGVFAAGDATTTPFKQIIIAMGEGSKASLSAFDYLIRLPELAATA